MADVTFRYDRAPTGELSGESLVEQTEEALSGLGQSSSHAEEEAARAVEIATEANAKSDQAVSTATSAQETANGALTTAQSAQSSANQAVQTAQSAVTTAQGASQTAQNAVSTAQSAVTAAQSAQTAAENAESRASTSASAAEGSANSASAAQTAAESAQTSAGQAATIATQAQSAAAQSAQEAQAAAAAVGASARQIGEIITSTLPLSSAGLHLLDGALVDGSGIYADFVTYIGNLYQNDPAAACFTDETSWQSAVTQYGVCGKFVYDSVNDTVRLPKITGIVEGTTDLTALGDLVEAGLPNITGVFSFGGAVGNLFASGPGGAEGAFYPNEYKSGGRLSYGSGDSYNTGFDASRSSAIYGNSATVQPQTIKCLVYIVIATVTKTDIQVDIDNVSTELNRLNSNAVQVDHAQAFSDAQKVQACANIGADKVVASGTGYIRYESGLQICFGQFTVGPYSLNAWGQIFSNSVSSSVTFQVPFIVLPSISLVKTYGTSSYDAMIVNIVASGTGITSVGLARGTSVSNVTTDLKYIAVGYWK